MAISAYNYAFSYLLGNLIPRISAQLSANIKRLLLTVTMMKIENDNIVFSAIYARMFFKICYDFLEIIRVQPSFTRFCSLNVLVAIFLIMLTRVSFIAIAVLTLSMTPPRLLVAEKEIVIRLLLLANSTNFAHNKSPIKVILIVAVIRESSTTKP